MTNACISSDGSLEIEIDGTGGVGIDHDILQINGTVELNGSLDLHLGFQPCVGDGNDVELTVIGIPCPEDLIANDVVEFADLVSLLAAWGPCSECPADFNCDGFVDFADLLQVLAAWGPCE